MKFEFLDHPADVGFRAWGESKEELFAHCASALVAIMVDASGASARDIWQLAATGRDEESLLVNWLNEVLYCVDTQHVVFTSFAVTFDGPDRIQGVGYGEPFRPEKHALRLSLKAVTYHQLRLYRSVDQWVAEVYVDV